MVEISDIFHPPAPPPPKPPLPQNLNEVRFKLGGLEGSKSKIHQGMRLLNKIMILQGLNKQFNPFSGVRK